MKLIRVIPNHHQIAASNRALQFGDGHFTTIKVQNHQILLWPYHKKRLLDANERLAFPHLDIKRLEKTLQDIAKAQSDAIVKILICRGESQRGYAFSDDMQSVALIYTSDLNEKLFSYPDGIALVSLHTQIARQPLLAGIKHCNRLEQILIKKELTDKQQKDGLVFDTDGFLIETSLANIFVQINENWLTPDLSESGVAGVQRAFTLNKIKNIERRKIHQTEVAAIQAAVISNALIGWVSVASIDGRMLNQKQSQDFIQGCYA
ncbi:aminodeoxychorismate lyase [Catenovulum sediminis]|uniref:Aminodeoxychorismate lyase n=1 Tax=Catenovulum sediminis TaxID=1740262 RepID=A0ABV1RGS3_9ALTE